MNEPRWSPALLRSGTLGYVDHAPLAGFGAKLVWGERVDGSYVHVSVVPRGRACACVCPACGIPLVARRGEQLTEHFAHLGEGVGCGKGQETNAHLWAKAVLEREKRIWTPAVAERRGRDETCSHEARWVCFDQVLLERRSGDIVPDVVLVRADGKELLVEVRVTHACDDEKIAKLRRDRLPTIEVNLRALRTSSDRAAVEQALLERAPRVWLFNEKLDQLKQWLAVTAKAREEREAAIRRAREERETKARQEAVRRLEQRAGALLRMSPGEESSPRSARALRLMRERGLADWLRPNVQSPAFAAPGIDWQALICARWLVPTDVREFELPDFTVAEAVQHVADLVQGAMPAQANAELRSVVRKRLRSFLFPDEAVQVFLDELCAAGVLQWSGYGYELSDAQAEAILNWKRETHEADRRRAQFEDLLDAILDAVPEQEREAYDPHIWRRTRLEYLGNTPDAIVESGGGQWVLLERSLRTIKLMLDGTDIAPPSTLELPIVARQCALRQFHQERLAREAAARERSVVQAAHAALGPQAPGWLAKPLAGTRTPVSLARQGDIEYAEVRMALDRAIRTKQACEQASREAENRRAQLRSAARAALPPDRVELFLSAFAREFNRAPIDHCVTEIGLRQALSLLDIQSGRRARRR